MTKFVAVASGKGGVGKTTVAISLAQALFDQHRRVILVDGNLVTPHVGLHLGVLNPQGSLNAFLRKEKSLQEITYLHESGLSFIPASPSYEEFQKTNPESLGELFEHLDGLADFIIVDAPSGLGYETQQVLKHCEEMLLVTAPTLSAVIDALKTLQAAEEQELIVAGIVANMVHGRNELKKEEVESVLGHPLLAKIKYNQKIRKAAHRSLPLPYAYPRCQAARQFRKIAEYLCLTKR